MVYTTTSDLVDTHTTSSFCYNDSFSARWRFTMTLQCVLKICGNVGEGERGVGERVRGLRVEPHYYQQQCGWFTSTRGSLVMFCLFTLTRNRFTRHHHHHRRHHSDWLAGRENYSKRAAIIDKNVFVCMYACAMKCTSYEGRYQMCWMGRGEGGGLKHEYRKHVA